MGSVGLEQAPAIANSSEQPRFQFLRRITEPSAEDRLPALVVSALAVCVIASADYLISLNVSIGYLYIIPILLAAGFLPRWQIIVAAAVCALLRERLGPFSNDGLVWTREAFVFVSFSVAGLLAPAQLSPAAAAAMEVATVTVVATSKTWWATLVTSTWGMLLSAAMSAACRRATWSRPMDGWVPRSVWRLDLVRMIAPPRLPKRPAPGHPVGTTMYACSGADAFGFGGSFCCNAGEPGAGVLLMVSPGGKLGAAAGLGVWSISYPAGTMAPGWE